MNILIIDGWTKDGNQDHYRAGCVRQTEVFEALIKDTLPGSKIHTICTDRPESSSAVGLDVYDAAVWTGGGGNIYLNNAFNREQLALCERVLAKVPYFWGSCWGLQVVVTVFGGLVTKALVPEIGIARKIVRCPTTISHDLFQGKPNTFDAPAHHADEVSRLPSGFEILAENDVTMQVIESVDRKIFCTQYHPELGYDYLRKLLEYWRPNYTKLFTEIELQQLLQDLTTKEHKEGSLRKIELQNWLKLTAQNIAFTGCGKA
ncbi:MAG: GMP synthase (glutamine-hydrolyzing) [Parasphingorhabdus sp.]